MFYESLERAMHNYLRAKLRIETTEMAKEKIAQMLKEKGADTDSITQFIELLKSCEFARYASGASNNVASDYEKATLVVTQLDKQL